MVEFKIKNFDFEKDAVIYANKWVKYCKDRNIRTGSIFVIYDSRFKGEYVVTPCTPVIHTYHLREAKE